MSRLRGVAVSTVAGFLLAGMAYALTGAAFFKGTLHGTASPEMLSAWRWQVTKLGAMPGAVFGLLTGSGLRRDSPSFFPLGLSAGFWLVGTIAAWITNWEKFIVLSTLWKLGSVAASLVSLIALVPLGAMVLGWLAVASDSHRDSRHE